MKEQRPISKWKYLLYAWLMLLIVLNVIPIGNDANQSLSGKKIFQFRLDYVIHFSLMLGFAWLWVFGKVMGLKWFVRNERQKFSLLTLSFGVGLELLQLFIPWRSFNPVDMVYNVVGAVVVVVVVGRG